MDIIPIADQLPVPWPWFQALLLLTFLLHLILMNFILGGSILTLFELFKNKQTMMGAKSLPTLIALTINLGVPPLLFVQVLYGNLFYSSSIIMAWPWLIIIPILILAYYGAYIFLFKNQSKPVLAKISLSISSIILLFIAFLFVNNITLMMAPERWSKYFSNASGWNLNLSEITLFPRYLHYVTASIAIAGLGMAIFAQFKTKNSPEEKDLWIKKGLRTFAFGTMIQMIIGVLFLVVLPKEVMMQFMGKNLLFTILLLIAIAVAIYAITTALKGKLWLTLYSILIVMVAMVFIRDFVRRSYLSDHFTISSLEVNTEYGSMILFLGAFAVGIIALVYMVKIVIKSFKS